jgi:hypothetical protein
VRHFRHTHTAKRMSIIVPTHATAIAPSLSMRVASVEVSNVRRTGLENRTVQNKTEQNSKRI